MNNLPQLIEEYLHYCHTRKRLSSKTIRAYGTDLNYYEQYISQNALNFLDKRAIGNYVDLLHNTKAPKTVKRKIASLQTFYRHLFHTEQITEDPMLRLDLTFRLPQRLPRHIPNHVLNALFQELYARESTACTEYQLKCAARNVAVIELLFSTGLRISELCELTTDTVNLHDKIILIHGKGNKERILHITEAPTIQALYKYIRLFSSDLTTSQYFFINKLGHPLSPQSVRNMINHLTQEASIAMHITPHMFRHSFATGLVNQDVDIRCIQEILGHSSIRTTEIYTHVDQSKQKSVLESKNPRKFLSIHNAS